MSASQPAVPRAATPDLTAHRDRPVPAPAPRRAAGARVLGILLLGLALVPARPAPARHDGGPSMLEPHTAALLVDYFDAFLRDQDLDRFRQSVTARYTEGTLERLAQSQSIKARRAAILALGLVGSIEANATVARGLRDGDPVVRELAVNALWAIWFRAGSPADIATLEQVRDLIRRERLTEAIGLASTLIERAPDFAEAYNQRAIAHFGLERFEDSAADCRRALERNPYHVGALGGLGRCYIELDRRPEAIRTYRRALTLQPFDEGLRQLIRSLEAPGD